jgi:hypothetical protein
MAYTDIYTAATDDTHILRKQTAVALHKAAVDILNEAANTELHKEREFWAFKVMRDPAAWAAIAIWKVLENSTIAAAPTTSTDSDVQFVINGLVNDLWRA